MVFIASSRHPLWRVVRRSMQLLTGAVMLTAVLGSAPASAVAAPPPVMTSPVVSVAVNPVLELESSAVACAEPADDICPVAASERPAPVALTVISTLSGRLLAAAPGERAPPRL